MKPVTIARLWVREQLAVSKIDVKHVRTHQQLADFFTKPLPATTFKNCCQLLGLKTPSDQVHKKTWRQVNYRQELRGNVKSPYVYVAGSCLCFNWWKGEASKGEPLRGPLIKSRRVGITLRISTRFPLFIQFIPWCQTIRGEKRVL